MTEFSDLDRISIREFSSSVLPFFRKPPSLEPGNKGTRRAFGLVFSSGGDRFPQSLEKSAVETPLSTIFKWMEL
jgi:hypothetical protein